MKAKEQLEKAQNWMETFGELNPESMKHFQKLMGAVEKDNVLFAKTKELIGISISITQQCEWCIAFHVNNALEEGSTEEEIIESA